MKVKLKKAATKGFSLVELLVVIAVIGIMAAIAIPMISNINAKSKDAKDRRNAQSIASMASAALAAGHTWDGAPPTEDTVVGELTGSGVTITAQGSFDGTKFHVPNLSDEDIAGAKTYLEYDDTTKQLTYKPDF